MQARFNMYVGVPAIVLTLGALLLGSSTWNDRTFYAFVVGFAWVLRLVSNGRKV